MQGKTRASYLRKHGHPRMHNTLLSFSAIYWLEWQAEQVWQANPWPQCWIQQKCWIEQRSKVIYLYLYSNICVCLMTCWFEQTFSCLPLLITCDPSLGVYDISCQQYLKKPRSKGPMCRVPFMSEYSKWRQKPSPLGTGPVTWFAVWFGWIGAGSSCRYFLKR